MDCCLRLSDILHVGFCPELKLNYLSPESPSPPLNRRGKDFEQHRISYIIFKVYDFAACKHCVTPAEYMKKCNKEVLVLSGPKDLPDCYISCTLCISGQLMLVY